MRKPFQLLVFGVLTAMLIQSVCAAGEYLTAQQSINRIYVDGKQVDLVAYVIDGHNYVRLRDVGEVVGFNVYWDGTVQVDTGAPYTGEPPADTTEQPVDYSAVASPAVFTKPYTREAYNALREAMVTGHGGPVAMSSATKTAMINVEAAVGSYPCYDLKSLGNGEYEFTAKRSTAYSAAAESIQDFLASLSGKSDTDKLYAFACKVSDGLEYKVDAWTAPGDFFTTPGPHTGNCTSYAHNFKFLCDCADIPCILVHSDDHQWVEVYVEDRWYSADITGFDVTYTTGSVTPRLLFDQSEMQGYSYRQSDPQLTRMAKELMVPGSTKE